MLAESGAEQGSAPPPRLREELRVWIDKHCRLEQRLGWLLEPNQTRERLSSLDPLQDAEQIWCFVHYDMRPDFLHCAWGNASKRIAQVESMTAFLHATGRAEAEPIARAEETLYYFYYFFDWGPDSFHGRAAIEGMNRIHGHYFLHNDGLKYVLLNAAFTVLDGLERIGHRPLSDKERLGYFHATIKMGKAMRIQGLSHSWDEMHAWFWEMSRAWGRYSPRKARMWRAIHDGFDRALGIPAWLGGLRRLPELYAMDETFRLALGLRAPSAAEPAALRQLLRLLARMRGQLPVGPWILSLQNFYSFPNGLAVEELGKLERSPRLPSACPFSGMGQRSPRRREAAVEIDLPTLSWDEVKKHDGPDDLWVVFGGYVYDVSSFAENHPGGLDVLQRGVGRDLTHAFEAAGHSDMTKAFTQNFLIGRIESVATEVEARRAHARAELGAAE
jgi:hypothetical protein